MKVFVTGASGFVGRAVVQELLAAGHQVVGLARSVEAAQQLVAAGVVPFMGDLTQPEALAPAIAASDAVIHLGFIHDFTRFKDMCMLDAVVIESIGEKLKGTTKPFIITSAIGIIAKEGVVIESDRAGNSINPRVATEEAADLVARQDVHVSVVRLSPVIHDQGDVHGFLPSLIRLAKEKGVSAYWGDGSNLWPAAHRLDVAKLYVHALETIATPGTRYHAVAESGVPLGKIAAVVAEKLDLPLVAIPTAEIEQHFTWFTHFAKFNIKASSAETQLALSWQPTHPTLLKDLEGTVYFPSV